MKKELPWGNKRKKNYPGVTKSQTDFRCQPHLAHRSPPRNFFSASAFCTVQLILRCCGSGVGGVAGFAPKPNF